MNTFGIKNTASPMYPKTGKITKVITYINPEKAFTITCKLNGCFCSTIEPQLLEYNEKRATPYEVALITEMRNQGVTGVNVPSPLYR